MRLITTVFAAAALAGSIAACDEQTEIEPGADNAIVEAMPETPDRSETATDEELIREGGPAPQAATGETGQTGTAPAY